MQSGDATCLLQAVSCAAAEPRGDVQVTTSGLASLARLPFNLGVSAGEAGRARRTEPEQPIKLYEFEACPFCRRGRPRFYNLQIHMQKECPCMNAITAHALSCRLHPGKRKRLLLVCLCMPACLCAVPNLLRELASLALARGCLHVPVLIVLPPPTRGLPAQAAQLTTARLTRALTHRHAFRGMACSLCKGSVAVRRRVREAITDLDLVVQARGPPTWRRTCALLSAIGLKTGRLVPWPHASCLPCLVGTDAISQCREEPVACPDEGVLSHSRRAPGAGAHDHREPAAGRRCTPAPRTPRATAAPCARRAARSSSPSWWTTTPAAACTRAMWSRATCTKRTAAARCGRRRCCSSPRCSQGAALGHAALFVCVRYREGRA